jgi:nucleoside-diphosphate-sugar epimerase
LWPGLRAAALEGRDFPMSPGLQVRDFVEVGEVARQLLAGLDLSAVEPGRPRVAHVASGHAQTLRAFAETWWSRWGAAGRLIPGAVPMRAGEVMRIVPDMTERSDPTGSTEPEGA